MKAPTALSNGSAPANWNPYRGRVTRNGIEYVSGTSMGFELVTDACTYIREVRVGSIVLTTTSINNYYYSSSAQPAGLARTGYSLWIFGLGFFDGTTNEIVITVGRVAGTGMTAHKVPVVHVLAVHPISAPTPVTISRPEMWNFFTSALYRKFNGASNSFNIINEDGSTGRRLYGYDPASFLMSMDHTGIGFSFKFKAEVDNWCDPTVHVDAKFKLTAKPSSLGFEWRPGDPRVSLGWPTRCQAVDLIPLIGQIKRLLEWLLADDPANSLRSSLTESIGSALADSGSSLFYTGTAHSDSAAQIFLSIPAPAVEILVPYDSFTLGRAGTLFADSDQLLLLASGLGADDYVANAIQQPPIKSGPNGIPLAGSVTDWPNPLTVARSGPLPFPGRPVANLLARTRTLRESITYGYRDGCGIGAVSGPRTATVLSAAGPRMVVFGINETVHDAERKRGYRVPGYHLRILFIGVGADSICSSIRAPIQVIR